MIDRARVVSVSTLLLAASLPAVALPSVAPSSDPAAASDPAKNTTTDEREMSPLLAALPEARPLSVKFDCQPASGRTPLQLGDTVQCVAELQHPATDLYEPPAVVSWGDGWQQQSLQTERVDGDPPVTRLRAVLQAVAVGSVPVAPLTLMVKGPEGARRFSLPKTELRVEGIIDPARTDVALREPLEPLPLLWRDRLWPLVGPLGLLVCALLLRWLSARRRRVVPEQELDPIAEALLRFDRLRAIRPTTAGHQQSVVSALSRTVRRYLHRRFDVDALECTTDELIARLTSRQPPVPGLDLATLEAYLRTADLVKYANLAVSAEECEASIATARTIVTRVETATAANEKKPRKKHDGRSDDRENHPTPAAPRSPGGAS